MVQLLAAVLDVPLRERNAMLLAAGFAPAYPEASLDAPSMSLVRTALDAILAQHEPFPAVVLDRRWDIVRVNQGAARFFRLLLGDAADGPGNVLRLVFDPRGLRPFIVNWEEVARSLVLRVQREAVGGVPDAAAAEVLAEVLGHPEVPGDLRRRPPETAPMPVIPVRFRKDGASFDFFSAITTLGTPQDVTAQEVRIESFFPSDPQTAERTRALATATSR